MAESFPENAVEVMPMYITSELLNNLSSVTAALNTIIHEGDFIQHSVNDSRKALRDFLQDPIFQQDFVETEPSGRRLLYELYFTMRSRQRFDAALTLIQRLRPVGGFSFSINSALRREPIQVHVGNPDGPQFTVTLRGYGGPDLTQAERTQLNDVRSFLFATGPERRFRLGLLRGDIHVGLREFEVALQEYDAIRRELNAVQLSSDRRKFLAIRSGFAHLARGDQLYRSTRDLSSDTAAAAIAHYQAAGKVVQDHAVSEANPFHQDIKDYANKRMIQLSNFLNFLGYANTYVPAAPRFGGGNDNDSMFGLARARVSAALRVKNGFESYLQAAEQTQRAAAEALNGVREAQASISSAEEKRTLAGLRRDAASARLELVKSKNERQKSALFRDQLKEVAAIVSTGAAAGPVGVVAAIVVGAVSFAVNTKAGLEELDIEEKLAELDLRIAESEVRLVDLEILNAASRARFFEEQQAFLVNGAELNLEVYYALAREYERLTEVHMEAAINLAFRAERRAAFERGEPTLPRIRLEYLTPVASDLGVGGWIIAPDLLDRDLLELNEAFQQGGQVRTDFDLQISLRNDYPIEFSAFLQSGILPFKISLYDIEHFRPGTSDQRIRTIHVEIVGLGGAVANISGRLRHSGTFMVRDRASAAEAGRLLPTPEELADALAMFQQGRTSTITTKGITLWQVDPREQELTNLEDDPDIEEFRDYGLTGVWEFELLPSENPDLDFHQIGDILIKINGTAIQGDPGFRAHIRALVKKYEQEEQPEGQDEALDRTTAVAMKQSFLSDAFADFLATGVMSFQIQAATFPDRTIANTKLKTVLFQAVDEEGKGVEGVRLIVSKEGASVTFDRTTLANGFSEDLNIDIPFLEPSLRFAMEGLWRIEAADMTRLATVNDLIMFFIYALPEGAGDE